MISTTRDKAAYATYVLVETAMLRKNISILLLYVMICDYFEPEGLGRGIIIRSTYPLLLKIYFWEMDSCLDATPLFLRLEVATD